MVAHSFDSSSIISSLDALNDYNSCKALLNYHLYRDLGWLNAGIILPEGYNFIKVYSNRSGSSCLYADHTNKAYYSVDMGD